MSPGAPDLAPVRPLLACVVLAHTDPTHVRRLVAALAPFPVFLHCDRSTPKDVFADMTRDLPGHCTVLDRYSTGWAKWENVAAELAGYRAALATEATHIAVLTGSDYPLAATSDIADMLAGHRKTSFAAYHRLPYEQWGRSGGLARLRYRHWAYRKHMLRLPVPRRLPHSLTFAGGSQLKVLCRKHAALVLAVAQEHPELVRFFRRSWVADETFVGSVLSTPEFAPDWPDEHARAGLWWIGWDGSRRKSPPWVGLDDYGSLSSTVSQSNPAPLFARKFSTAQDTAVLDAIDAGLRVPNRGLVR
jgi:hypothetical protein